MTFIINVDQSGAAGVSHGLAGHDYSLRLRPLPDGSVHLLRHPHQVRGYHKKTKKGSLMSP